MGLTATVAYTMDEDATVEQDVFSANVLYKNGALLAGVACEMHGEDLSGGDASKGIRAMASYKTGDLKDHCNLRITHRRRRRRCHLQFRRNRFCI